MTQLPAPRPHPIQVTVEVFVTLPDQREVFCELIPPPGFPLIVLTLRPMPNAQNGLLRRDQPQTAGSHA
jgi:hypothetical protein